MVWVKPALSRSRQIRYRHLQMKTFYEQKPLSDLRMIFFPFKLSNGTHLDIFFLVEKLFFCLLMFWRGLVLYMWPCVFTLPQSHYRWRFEPAWHTAPSGAMGTAGLELILLATRRVDLLWTQKVAGGIISRPLLSVGHSVSRKSA